MRPVACLVLGALSLLVGVDVGEAGAATSGSSGSAKVGAGPSPGLSASALRRLPSDLRSSPSKLALIATFRAEAKRYGVPADLLMAVAYTESGWRSSVVSPEGAIGICQLLPDTARWLARDLIGLPGLRARDPEDNIRMGARFLKQLLRSFRTERLALAAYFDGHGTVARNGVSPAANRYAKIVQQRRTMFQGL
jgi:soluble lytic murein transglycosylase-like protein